MRIMRVFTAFALVGALGACMSPEPASRASSEPAVLGQLGGAQLVAIQPHYAIKGITVRVPETLEGFRSKPLLPRCRYCLARRSARQSL